MPKKIYKRELRSIPFLASPLKIDILFLGNRLNELVVGIPHDWAYFYMEDRIG